MKHYFYQKPDGTYFAVNQKQARQFYGKYDLVGVSDGQEHARIVREEEQAFVGLRGEIADLQEKLERIAGVLERMEFEEFLDEDDERMVRAKAKMESLKHELAEKQSKHSAGTEGYFKAAFDAELQIALEHGPEVPPDDTWVVYDGLKRVTNEQRKRQILR